MRHQGQISEWDDERGFGFVRPREGTGRVFIHISAFPPGSRRPARGDMVRYGLAHDEHGRPRATNVTYISERALAREWRRLSKGRSHATIIAATFLALVAAGVMAGLLHWAVLVFYALLGVRERQVRGSDRALAHEGSKAPLIRARRGVARWPDRTAPIPPQNKENLVPGSLLAYGWPELHGIAVAPPGVMLPVSASYLAGDAI
jgi:cold shock CspA family protein